jgi:hypothetical protein
LCTNYLPTLSHNSTLIGLSFTSQHSTCFCCTQQNLPNAQSWIFISYITGIMTSIWNTLIIFSWHWNRSITCFLRFHLFWFSLLLCLIVECLKAQYLNTLSIYTIDHLLIFHLDSAFKYSLYTNIQTHVEQPTLKILFGSLTLTYIQGWTPQLPPIMCSICDFPHC